MPRVVSERSLALLIGAVQFVNILDFVMVMPLGPDFAGALLIPEAKLGYLAASYTAAACVSGLLGAFFLERFDRRRALAVTLMGLAAGTALGGFATGLGTLLAARLVAGAFGGPATSLSLSIIADAVPPERRGKALGAVMGAFSVANIVGLPMALKLAQWGSWRLPFFVVAAMGLAINVAALWLLPPMRQHLLGLRGGAVRGSRLRDLLGRKEVLFSYTMTAVTMMAGFIVLPNLPAYLLRNLGFPRSHMDRLYLAGGVLSLVTLRAMGWLVDRWGSFRVGTMGSVFFACVLFFGFVHPPEHLWVFPLFLALFLAMGTRNVAYSTLTSKVPSPTERARFMSVQSSVQHAASAVGAALSSQLLWQLPGNRLGGMARVALISMALTAALPPLLWRVETFLRRRGLDGRPAGPLPSEGSPAPQGSGSPAPKEG